MTKPLDRLAELETFQEILDLLTPHELSAVSLSYLGMNSVEIADTLGITHQAVSLRIKRAQARILAAMPELASEAQARSRHRASRRKGENYDHCHR